MALVLAMITFLLATAALISGNGLLALLAAGSCTVTACLLRDLADSWYRG